MGVSRMPRQLWTFTKRLVWPALLLLGLSLLYNSLTANRTSFEASQQRNRLKDLFRSSGVLESIQSSSQTRKHKFPSKAGKKNNRKHHSLATEHRADGNRRHHSLAGEHRADEQTIIVWDTERRFSWMGAKDGTDGFSSCPVYKNCALTTDKLAVSSASAIVIHGYKQPFQRWASCLNQTYENSDTTCKTYMKENPFPPPNRSTNQLWVYINNESQKRSPSGSSLNPFNNFFNYTITVKRESDISFEMLYSAGSVVELAKPEKFKFSENVAVKKTRFAAWYVSHCAATPRWPFAEELARYIPLDIFGKCGKSDGCGSNGHCTHSKIGEYKFYLSFENSLCTDYITEKFWRPLSARTLPVALGAPLSSYEHVAPPQSFLHVENFTSVRELADYLLYLNQSDESYNKYHNWRGTHQYIRNLQDSTQDFRCKLCKMVSERKPQTVRLSDVWSEEKDCKKDLSMFKVSKPGQSESWSPDISPHNSQASGHANTKHEKQPQSKKAKKKLGKSSIGAALKEKGKKPLILLWSKWHKTNTWWFNSDSFTKCSTPCDFTHNKSALQTSDLVVFHGWQGSSYNESTKKRSVVAFGDKYEFPPLKSRPSLQPWLYYNKESQLKSASGYDLEFAAHYFNYTMTFKTNSDAVDAYGPTRVHKLQASQQSTTPLPNYAARKKRIVVWYASNCRAPQRNAFVAELKKHIQVDVFGKCGVSDGCAKTDTACSLAIRKQYKFYLAFENSLCRDYISEKFFKTFKSENVPVVLGAFHEDYTKRAPPHSFIHAGNFTSPQLLAEYLNKLDSNDDSYNEYHAWRKSYSFHDPESSLTQYAEVQYSRDCGLCDLAAQKPKRTVNIAQFWNKQSDCVLT